MLPNRLPDERFAGVQGHRGCTGNAGHRQAARAETIEIRVIEERNQAASAAEVLESGVWARSSALSHSSVSSRSTERPLSKDGNARVHEA